MFLYNFLLISRNIQSALWVLGDWNWFPYRISQCGDPMNWWGCWCFQDFLVLVNSWRRLQCCVLLLYDWISLQQLFMRVSPSHLPYRLISQCWGAFCWVLVYRIWVWMSRWYPIVWEGVVLPSLEFLVPDFYKILVFVDGWWWVMSRSGRMGDVEIHVGQ